jgi:uncharacterized protein YgiM (DUF1202 family)
MKLQEINEAKKDLYVVTKPFATSGGRDALFQKGDKLRVVSVDKKGFAKVTLPDGERIGITIPVKFLKKTR